MAIPWYYCKDMNTTIPLLHDNHNHVALYGALGSCLDVSSMQAETALDMLKGLPSDRLSVVRGWKSFELPMTTGTLSRLPPLLLINFSLHGFVISDSGLPFVEQAAPQLAKHRADQSWCEANVPAIFAAYTVLAGINEAKLCSYIDGRVQYGIGSSDEMTVPTISAIDVCLASSYSDRIGLWAAPALYDKLDKPRRARLSGIKLFIDGALGARSAAICGPWIGGGEAKYTYKDDELLALLLKLGMHGTGLAVHAIGELAIEQALLAFKKALERGADFSLLRLEHAQFIDRKQADRAKAMGVVLSMQPNFTSDSRDYVDRLPQAYLARNNPFRMLIDEAGFVPGKDLIFGSDGMPDGIAYAATQALFPPYPSQYLSIDELIAGYGVSKGISGTLSLNIDKHEGSVRVEASSVSNASPQIL